MPSIKQARDAGLAPQVGVVGDRASRMPDYRHLRWLLCPSGHDRTQAYDRGEGGGDSHTAHERPPPRHWTTPSSIGSANILRHALVTLVKWLDQLPGNEGRELRPGVSFHRPRSRPTDASCRARALSQAPRSRTITRAHAHIPPSAVLMIVGAVACFSVLGRDRQGAGRALSGAAAGLGALGVPGARDAALARRRRWARGMLHTRQLPLQLVRGCC